MDDPQTVQKMMQTPEAAAIMEKAGTDKSSMEMIPLPNGKPGIWISWNKKILEVDFSKP